MRKPEYELKLRSDTEQGKKIFSFRSADGLVSKNKFREEEILLADTVDIDPDDEVLIPEAVFGFLGVVIAERASEGYVSVTERSNRAFQLTKINFDINDIRNFDCRNTADILCFDRIFDLAVYAPKPYKPINIVKNNLADIIEALGVGGDLWICSSKNKGLNRFKDYLKEFPGELSKEGSRGRNKVYRYRKTEKFKPERPSIDYSFTAELDGIEMDFRTYKGLFSAKSLDKGTKFLLENLEASASDTVLDLGCGYGAISVFLARKFGCKVFMSDNDSLAIKAAQENMKKNDIQQFKAETADCLEGFGEKKFDFIVSNPPTHQGEGVTDEIFEESYKRLRTGGEFWIVYNRNMRFERKLRRLFETVEIVEEKENFRVLKAVKK